MEKETQSNPEDKAEEKQQEQEVADGASTDATTDGKDSKDDAGENVTDKHGLPGINREKYARDIEERDAKIAELEAKIAEAAKSDATAKELKEQIDALKAESADKDLSHALAMAGCIDDKAAKARLEDFDGDIEKLKATCPYLFEEKKKTGSTGRKPAGASESVDDLLDRGFKKR